MGVIATRPPDEMYQSGLEIDVQCARCGSSCEYHHCDSCEDGYDGHDCGEDVCCCLHPEENVLCQICNGEGGWNSCMSAEAWCMDNPLEGREDVKRGAVEWFTHGENTER